MKALTPPYALPYYFILPILYTYTCICGTYLLSCFYTIRIHIGRICGIGIGIGVGILCKKREAQKVSKYRTLVESQGGDFTPLVTGSHGNTTSSAKKLLQVTFSNRNTTDPKLSRCTYDYWITMISFTLHKTVASQVIAQSAKASGRQYSGPYATSSFPDSAETHFDMSG